ncbi:MAG: winged helix-turn-helix transcriptional regulator [Syntrophaceae bacterium]|nr:winged helix-turn-helix transcriptional regulator [Syntrophaceae bacterium]
MDEFIKVMKALSDPNRVKALKLLQHRVMCVCEIQAALNIAQPTVSKHMKILEDAGLVFCEKDGLWANYGLGDGSRSPYAATLLGNLRHWLNNEPEIKKLDAVVPLLNREILCKKQEPTISLNENI